MQGGLCLGVGVSVQGVSVQGGLCPRGSLSGGLCPGGLCSGGLCLGVSVWRVSVQGVSVWRVSVQGVSVQGGLCHEDPQHGKGRAVRILL